MISRFRVSSLLPRKLVELGLSLSGVKTALNVERGMALIQRRLEPEDGDADEQD